ncbi:CxxC motif-containing protein (DUF1111 family) [Tenacibaculum adriaticum]|uniref:CxxC motif-containing protein (DUF1111 family) n=1 Tax=Tenacibaculum adriaticum TaxID=413713 RepID=A0A5S5DS81_9FLAO|nr:di-heme oxidoredictase family protein [Tenacibaculum adriaticum]TYP98790.1 CxxC motif-containing protein (DUF1111 family) [Tenacibaculum adriaticum]
MKKLFYITISFFSILLNISCSSDYDETTVKSIPNLSERYKTGGETTVFENGFFSFDNPASNLNTQNLETHLAGDAQFEQAFVTAPAITNPGLGAQFNNTSCVSCHPKDGRASFPSDINSLSGFFLRTSIPGTNPHGGPNPTPGFGEQLQNQAVYGVTPEVKFQVDYQDMPVTFKDGTTVTLKKPIYSIAESYIDFPSNAMLSPRIGPPVFGLGLLEAITEEDIIEKQDINDADADGISGKANYVWDASSQSIKLGRFGWKANTPTILIQSAGAYNNDIGITNYIFSQESSFGQTNGEQNNNDDPEIANDILDQVTLYCRTLAVPAARNLEEPEVVRGYELFDKAKCSSCHTPKHVTGNFTGIPAISNQTIYPYTDMLLHDMGEGLADGRPDFLATGKEWKTRPLWGIGLTRIVNGHTNFLHDGRAKNIEEAILWHGGEAENSKNMYTNFSKSDRDALLAFINAL